VAAIGGGSLLVYGSGLWFNSFDSSKKSLINNPFAGEISIQKFLGGRYHKGKSNFLDSRFGSAVTPVTGAMLLASMDISWPAENKGKGLSQDLFLYLSGLLATRGLTDLAKAAVARPRPYLKMAVDEKTNYSGKGITYDYNSFFSGHVSGAFFVSTFLNKHTRMIMRRELHDDDYRQWRWLPPTIFYTWSSFVGWSRIHAWKHYFSDIAIGALAGWLVGELFYSFNGKNEESNGNAASGQTMFGITLTL
jgi:membrane-associated phospholipid phosphatase